MKRTVMGLIWILTLALANAAQLYTASTEELIALYQQPRSIQGGSQAASVKWSAAYRRLIRDLRGFARVGTFPGDPRGGSAATRVSSGCRPSAGLLFKNNRLERTIGGADAALDAEGDINRILVRSLLNGAGFASGNAGVALIAFFCDNVRHNYFS